MKHLNLKITTTIFIFALMALAGPVLACTPIGGLNLNAVGTIQRCTATGYVPAGSSPGVVGNTCSTLGELAFDSTTGAPLYCNNANPKVWTAVAAAAAVACTHGSAEFTTVGTFPWSMPMGCSVLTVTIIGGGGGGAGAGQNACGQSIGGGGGKVGASVFASSIAAIEGTSLPVIVGSGGTAGSGGYACANYSAGGAGTKSCVGTTCYNGGNGGAIAGAIGATTYWGGAGAAGLSSTGTSVAGGAAGSVAVSGGNSPTTSLGGGGGGGGIGNASTAGGAGGTGSQGYVSLTW